MKNLECRNGERKWGALVALASCFLLHSAFPADLTKGYTFSSGEQNVTHTKLNNLVDQATINASFFTDKSAVTTPAGADLALIYSAGASALRKITLANLIYGNPFTITNLTADATPALDDFLMTYDVSDTALKKATLRKTIFESADLIANRTNWPTPARITTSLLAYDSVAGTWSSLTRSNLFYQFYEFNPFTNQPAHTSPTNDDRLLIWDSAAGTNKTTSLAGLVTNTPAVGNTNAADVLWGYSTTSNRLATFSLGQVLQWLTNRSELVGFVGNVGTYTNRFVSTNFTLANGLVGDTPHSLGATPSMVRWVLACTATEDGYSVGDEIDALPLLAGNDNQDFTGGGNSTNVFLVVINSATISIKNKATGASATLDPTKWVAKCYARP